MYTVTEFKEFWTVCDRKRNSGRNWNRIAIIWLEPEPDQHPTKLAVFLTGFYISTSVVLSNTVIWNFYCKIVQ